MARVQARVPMLALVCFAVGIQLFAQSQQVASRSSPVGGPEISAAPLSDDEEKMALEYMLSSAPDRTAAARDAQLSKTRSPEVYWAHLRSMLEHNKQMATLKNEDPKASELFQRQMALERKVVQLTNQYRESKSDEKRAHLRNELNAALGELFDVRGEVRLSSAVGRLQREIREVQSENAGRKATKDKIVADQLRERTGS